jgi:DNA-3-methyladenine glycosylase
MEPLDRAFFAPSAEVIAPRLLGHWLIRNTPNGPYGGPIVETEAYLREDPACHAARGQTGRNVTMFGPPGHAYVYFIYGCHFCVNAVCCQPGVAEAVLIRAIEPALGERKMRRNRPKARGPTLTNGPAKLCVAMAIDRDLDGADLCDATSALWIARNPALRKFRSERGPLVTTTRIGITKAASLPLRFCLLASPFVSRPPKPEDQDS